MLAQLVCTEGHLLGLDWKGLLNARAQRLHHFSVAQVINNVLQDVTVCYKPQRTEHHQYGYVRPNIGYAGLQRLHNPRVTAGQPKWSAEVLAFKPPYLHMLRT